jgi:hypothetical protein
MMNYLIGEFRARFGELALTRMHKGSLSWDRATVVALEPT